MGLVQNVDRGETAGLSGKKRKNADCELEPRGDVTRRISETTRARNGDNIIGRPGKVAMRGRKSREQLLKHFENDKWTPGYKNKFILIDSQWLVKTNGATFIFIGKLGNKFLPGQFWLCLSFASLSVTSGLAPSPDFWSCEPKLRHLYCFDMKLCVMG